MRLIRSKGVGVYFVTQNPLDIPESVLGQLGNRVQHALRAFTPKDQNAVKSAAETMRRIYEALGGEMFREFFEKFGFKLEIEHGAPRATVGGTCVVQELDNYCKQQVKC